MQTRKYKIRDLKMKVGSAISRLMGAGVLTFLGFSWYWSVTSLGSVIQGNWGLNIATIGGLLTLLGIASGFFLLILWAIATCFIGLFGLLLVTGAD